MRDIVWKLLTFLVGVGMLILGVMFSLAVIAVVAVLGLVVFGYVLWKTRHLRKVMREQSAAGDVIEGEVIVVEENPVIEGQVLPHDQSSK